MTGFPDVDFPKWRPNKILGEYLFNKELHIFQYLTK